MNRNTVILDGFSLTPQHAQDIAAGAPVSLSEASRRRVDRGRAIVDQLVGAGATVYGVTTGFGYLATKAISPEEQGQLQHNILLSHSAGWGDSLSLPETRLAMALRLNVLLRGSSGVRWLLCERMAALLNGGILPVIPAYGSVGASGDLIPLAHLALPLIGEGFVHGASGPVAAQEALRAAGLEPLRLATKEGLALVNGTQMMTAVGGMALWQAQRLSLLADTVCAFTMEALGSKGEVLEPFIHEMRGQPGQRASADRQRRCLEGSALWEREVFHRVQDPYSIRCAAQVHGASQDLLQYAHGVVARELNSATDNPLVDIESGKIFSGGNFHGQPLSFAFDAAALACSELANISERRLELLLNPSMSGLPPFLVRHEGLNSGYMTLQYLCAALVNENKTLCHPASVDSIPGNVGIEDHVSMGMTAAIKLKKIVANVEKVLSAEALASAQALWLRGEPRQGKGTAPLYRAIRDRVPPLSEDRYVAKDLDGAGIAVSDFIKSQDQHD